MYNSYAGNFYYFLPGMMEPGRAVKVLAEEEECAMSKREEYDSSTNPPARLIFKTIKVGPCSI